MSIEKEALNNKHIKKTKHLKQKEGVDMLPYRAPLKRAPGMDTFKKERLMCMTVAGYDCVRSRLFVGVPILFKRPAFGKMIVQMIMYMRLYLRLV